MALEVFSSLSLVRVVGLEHPQSLELVQAVPSVISHLHYVLPHQKKNPVLPPHPLHTFIFLAH